MPIGMPPIEDRKSVRAMTLKLRQRHRLVIAIVGVLLFFLLIIGIALRPMFPPVEASSPEFPGQTVTYSATGEERDDLFAKSNVSVRLFRESESRTLAIGLSAAKDFLKPDLLVYWSAGNSTTTEALPPSAKLLGAFVSATLPLPSEASTAEGQLILYSLANQEIVDVSRTTQFREQTR